MLPPTLNFNVANYFRLGVAIVWSLRHVRSVVFQIESDERREQAVEVVQERREFSIHTFGAYFLIAIVIVLNFLFEAAFSFRWMKLKCDRYTFNSFHSIYPT